MVLLLSSFATLLGGSNNAQAQEVESGSGDVSVASGSNRFVIWQDDAPGNNDIFIRRSTDSGVTWKPIVNLSNNAGNSYNPELAVSGSNIVVVWTQDNSANTLSDITVRVSTNDGATWDPKIILSKSGTNKDSVPRLAVSGSVMYVIWADAGSGDIFLRRSTDNGATWNPIVNLSDNKGNSYNPQVAVSASKVFVVWSQDTIDGRISDIMLRKSDDSGSTWGSKIRISASGTSFGSHPQIAVSGSKIYVVWDESGSREVYLRRSTDGGNSWKTIKNLSADSRGSSGPQIAVSGSKVYVVWEHQDHPNSGISFRRSLDNGATWKTTLNLMSHWDAPRNPDIFASGSTVSVIMIWATKNSANPILKASTDNGATWNSVFLDDRDGRSDDIQFPQVAVTGLEIYAVWEQGTSTKETHFRRSIDGGNTWQNIINLSNNISDSRLGKIAV